MCVLKSHVVDLFELKKARHVKRRPHVIHVFNLHLDVEIYDKQTETIKIDMALVLS